MWSICPGVFGSRSGLSGHAALLDSDYGSSGLGIGQSILSVQPYGLASLLPQFYQEHERLGIGAESLIDRFITDSPELYPRCRYNPLVEDELRDVYYSSLRNLSRSSLGDMELDVAEAWLSKLEQYYQRDQNDARLMNQPYVHRRSQHLFRALAEVAHGNRSARLSRVLYNFFVRHATPISSTESSATLGQWCWALFRGVLHHEERLQCLSKVLRQRPDLPLRLRQHGRRGQLLAQKMEMVAGSSGLSSTSSLKPRERLFRRATSEDLLGVNHLAARGIRSRSTSRDRRGMAGARIEELDELESDDLGLQPERLLMAHNVGRNQRLLQLQLNARLGDRLGLTAGTHALDSLGLGDDFDEHSIWDRTVDLAGYGSVLDI